MYMVMLFQTTLMNRLSSAPNWRSISAQVEQGCVDNWWQNFLFINSWFGSLKKCMGHTWYISVDMQLYFISPLLLIPLHRKPKLGLWLLGGSIVAFFIGSFISSYVLQEHADLFPHENGWEEFLYMVPYNRATPWLFGILFGYYMHLNKHKKAAITNNGTNTGNHKTKSATSILKKWAISTTICGVGIGLGVGIMYLVHPFLSRSHPYSPLEHSLYIATSHIVATFSILILIAAILTGYGGVLDLFWSAKIFAPLGRLSYSVYLIHILIVEIWYMGPKTNYYLSDENLLLNYVGILMYSVIFSPFLFLLVEQPFTNLDKLLLNTGNKSGTNSERKPIIPSSAETQHCSYVNNGLELIHRPNKGIV
ncbi:hypothetical protein C0J52_00556 [Blattella germanica]|nr:hypothetical protein C0J52_00556 [Blattella germanica]